MVLTDDTRKYIERHTGLSVEQIRVMTTNEFDSYVAQRSGLPEVPIVCSDSLMRLSYTSDIDREISRI